MKVEFAEETSVRKSLSFEIEPEVVGKEIDARARQYARKARLPGFRAGKVPLGVIKQRFRDQIEQDVAETLVNKVVFEELEGRGLRPVAAPKVTDIKIAADAPMTFRAVFETMPPVEPPEYKGLSVKARRASVADEAVDKELERMREQAARYDPVEGRPVQDGDHALVDVAWKPLGDGEPGRDENALLEVGDGDNHPDVNAALQGLSVGDKREVRVSYAEDHAHKGLAGRSFDYALELKAIKRKVVPALDDEFAKDLDVDSLAALRDRVRARLLAAEERRAEREVKEALVAELVSRGSFEVPDALVERQMDLQLERAVRGLALQGIDPRAIEMDWKAYRESQREEAVKAAKADILLDEIARREKIEVGPAELDAEVARLAQAMNKGKEALRAQMQKDGDLAALNNRIREEKTLDLIKANARLDFE